MRVRCEGREDAVWRLELQPDDDGQVALDVQGLDALREVIAAAHTPDSPCRAMVITSAAKGVFCRGMDLKRVVDAPSAERQRGVEAYVDTLLDLRRARPAVVCIVDGEAMGGGVGLAAASDWVIATQRASFGLPEVVLGLMPAMVLPLLCERMVPQQARWLAMSGANLGASEALVSGLADEVHEDRNSANRAGRRVLKRLLRADPRAVANIRSFTATLNDASVEDAVRRGGVQTFGDIEQASTRDAVRAFLNGEMPQWCARLPAHVLKGHLKEGQG